MEPSEKRTAFSHTSLFLQHMFKAFTWNCESLSTFWVGTKEAEALMPHNRSSVVGDLTKAQRGQARLTSKLLRKEMGWGHMLDL